MEKQWGSFLTFCGLMLWMTFIFCRLICFPVTIGIFIYDTYFSGIEAAKDVTAVEVGFYLSTLTFLFFLSANWFTKIHKGMMKMVFEKPQKAME